MSNAGSLEPLLSSWALSSVISEICQRVGIPFERINLQGLEGTVDGVVHTPADEAFKVIEALSQIFLFDVASFDGQVRFVPRGGNPVAHLTDDDLVATGQEIKKANRHDSITVPRVLHLEYYDVDGGLNPDKQTSDRSLDNRAVAETKVTTPVIMRTPSAARAAVINHKVAIEEQRGEIEITLTDEHLYLTDGDIITLNGERMRIKKTETEPFRQKYTAVYDRRSAYESNIQGIPINPPTDPPSLIIGDTILHFIDSHILCDSDDRLGYYVAASRAGDNWTGALVELSIDGGQSYIDSADVFVEATMGELTQPLPAAPRWYPDDVNTAEVELVLDDDLDPVTFREMLNRANIALIGDEIINFGGAEQVGPKSWELSHLLRGRKGSPIDSHPSGTRFIMLDRRFIFFIDAEVFDLNRTLTFRVTSFGSSVSHTESAVFTGQSQTERAVANLQAYRSGGQVHISWVGVGRLGGGGQVRHGAHFTGYRVSVNGSAQTTQDQSISVSDPGGSVIIEVAQINSLTGTGPVRSISI